MKKEVKNVLIFAASSDMANFLIDKLLEDNVSVFATSRKPFTKKSDKFFNYILDLTDKNAIENFFKRLPAVEFDAVICFQGVAITSPVEYLSEDELKKQFSVSLFSVLNILQNLKNKIKKDGLFINVSSMAKYGIFPFLSPYSIAKASVDILLDAFEIETGIKTVSIIPGVVKTKFWQYCIEQNKSNFSSFKDKYDKCGKFLKQNAEKNSNKGLSPVYISKIIYKCLYLKNPKKYCHAGFDAHFTKMISLFKGRFLFGIIRKVLNMRIRKNSYEQ